jgi:hypothetical protein
MGLMYGHVDNKRDAGSMADLREQVAEMREAAADGDL